VREPGAAVPCAGAYRLTVRLAGITGAGGGSVEREASHYPRRFPVQVWLYGLREDASIQPLISGCLHELDPHPLAQSTSDPTHGRKPHILGVILQSRDGRLLHLRNARQHFLRDASLLARLPQHHADLKLFVTRVEIPREGLVGALAPLNVFLDIVFHIIFSGSSDPVCVVRPMRFRVPVPFASSSRTRSSG